MKICVFSDIHGNGPAFRNAFKMIIKEGADLNVFLGDLCGYYYDQGQIYKMLLSVPNLISLQGNHDWIFSKIVKGDEDLRKDYLRKYGCSLEYLLGENNQELIRWISDLPESYIDDDSGLAFYHGSPWDFLDGYVYPDSPLEKFLDYPSSLFVLGHTHCPMVMTINDKLIVNPGSLGQPRNGGWPTYAVIDYPSNKVIFREVAYDKSELADQIDKLDANNEYLKKVIFR